MTLFLNLKSQIMRMPSWYTEKLDLRILLDKPSHVYNDHNFGSWGWSIPKFDYTWLILPSNKNTVIANWKTSFWKMYKVLSLFCGWTFTVSITAVNLQNSDISKAFPVLFIWRLSVGKKMCACQRKCARKRELIQLKRRNKLEMPKE